MFGNPLQRVKKLFKPMGGWVNTAFA